MPRKNPISPAVALMYADNRDPAANTNNTSVAGASIPDEANTIAPTYAPANNAHAAACQAADPIRAATTNRYQRSHALRRSLSSRGPIPVTRTSLPGDAVVARVNRCRASRLCGAPRSYARRSTPGRHDEVSTVGNANNASAIKAGWIDAKSTIVTPKRRIHPQVENSDMYK